MTREIELIAEIEALKMFASVTSNMVLEMKAYEESGLLGESMRESMMREIRRRIVFTEEQLRLVLAELIELGA